MERIQRLLDIAAWLKEDPKLKAMVAELMEKPSDLAAPRTNKTARTVKQSGFTARVLRCLTPRGR